MAKGKEVRVTVILECTNCVRKGVNKESKGISRYITQKNRHNTPSRLELKKFCPYCYKHTIHGEIKKQIESRCVTLQGRGLHNTIILLYRNTMFRNTILDIEQNFYNIAKIYKSIIELRNRTSIKILINKY